MSNKFIYPTLSLLAAACATQSIGRPPAPPVDWQSLVTQNQTAAAPALSRAAAPMRELADAYMHALASPGLSELAPLLDEDAHFAFAGKNDVHGRGLVVRAHEAALGSIDLRRFVTTRVLLTDSMQSLEWTLTGVDSTTRKPLALRGLTLLSTKADGSISDVHLYFDEAVVASQLGLGLKSLQALPRAAIPLDERQQFEQAPNPEAKTNLALVRASLEALEDDNEAAYAATMTDDVEIVTLEHAQPLRGRSDARAYVRVMNKAIGQLDSSVDNEWSIGPFVVVEYHIVGEQRAPLDWSPAEEDTLLTMSIVDVAEIKAGKIEHLWRYDNPGQIAQETRQVLQ